DAHHTLWVAPVVGGSRDPLGQQAPVAGRGLGARPVGPILGDDLLLIGEFGAVADDLLGLAQVAGTGVVPGPTAGAQLPAGVQAEGGDQAPVRGQEALHRSVPPPSRAPARGAPRGGGPGAGPGG